MVEWESGMPIGPNIFVAMEVFLCHVLKIPTSDLDKSKEQTSLGIKVSCCAPQSIAWVAIWIWLVGLNCVSRGVFSFVPAGWRVSLLVAFITYDFSRECLICKSSVSHPRR